MRKPPDPANLEVRFRWLSVLIVVAFGTALMAGLVLHVAVPGSPASVLFLQTGIVMLMTAPALRIVIAVAERIRQQDWTFVMMTVLVVAELAFVLWRASLKA
jgi:uncharacterized membrane protein